MQTVIGGVLANYDIFGEKNKPEILILHGWGHNINLWLPFANLLSSKYKVHLVDLPGFGSSPPPTFTFDTYDYVKFVEEFIKKFKLRDYILIGHSFGGKIAIILSSRHNSVRKLFLVSPSGINNRPLLILLKIYIFKLTKIGLFFLPNAAKKKIALLFAPPDYKNAGVLEETFKKVVSQNIRQQAKKIKVPTIIFWGEEDREIKPNNAVRLRSLIKNSHVRIIWQKGHSPQIESPDKFYNILREYI